MGKLRSIYIPEDGPNKRIGINSKGAKISDAEPKKIITGVNQYGIHSHQKGQKPVIRQDQK